MNTRSFETHWRQADPPPSGVRGIRYAARNITLSLVSALSRSREEKYLRLLFCHYVFDDQKKTFEKIISALNSIGTFVGTDTCIQMLEGKRKIDGKYFHLSFDDGVRNVFTNALPILQRHNVPAIFFVPTSMVSSDYEVTERYCLKTMEFKGVAEIVSWEELEECSALGYDVGSHTRTHARFSEISRSKERLKDEIWGSKCELEDRLGKECKYISWPYGKLSDADDLSLALVKEANYTACFGAFRGKVIPHKTNRFCIPRHHFAAQWPLSQIKFFAQGGMEKQS